MEAQRLSYPNEHVKKLSAMYSIKKTAAVSVFHLVEELTRCVNKAEIRKVQSVCFYNRPDNPAYNDLYDHISWQIGTYNPEEYSPVFKLRTSKRRGEFDERTPIVVGKIVDKFSDFLGIPTSAWYKVESAPRRISRGEKYQHWIVDGVGDYLARAKDYRVAAMLSARITAVGREGFEEQSEKMNRREFVDFMVKKWPPEKGELMRIWRKRLNRIYILAQLAMCDTYNQAAHIVGYLYVYLPVLFTRIADVWPEIRQPAMLQVSMRIGARLAPIGVSCGDLAVKTAVTLAAEEGANALDWFEGATRVIPYYGGVAARDMTNTRLNVDSAAQHYELFADNKPIAIAVSKQAALNIERAVSCYGRKKALERVRKVVEAYRNADDLV